MILVHTCALTRPESPSRHHGALSLLSPVTGDTVPVQHTKDRYRRGLIPPRPPPRPRSKRCKLMDGAVPSGKPKRADNEIET